MNSSLAREGGLAGSINVILVERVGEFGTPTSQVDCVLSIRGLKSGLKSSESSNAGAAYKFRLTDARESIHHGYTC